MEKGSIEKIKNAYTNSELNNLNFGELTLLASNPLKIFYNHLTSSAEKDLQDAINLKIYRAGRVLKTLEADTRDILSKHADDFYFFKPKNQYMVLKAFIKSRPDEYTDQLKTIYRKHIKKIADKSKGNASQSQLDSILKKITDLNYSHFVELSNYTHEWHQGMETNRKLPVLKSKFEIFEFFPMHEVYFQIREKPNLHYNFNNPEQSYILLATSIRLKSEERINGKNLRKVAAALTSADYNPRKQSFDLSKFEESMQIVDDVFALKLIVVDQNVACRKFEKNVIKAGGDKSKYLILDGSHGKKNVNTGYDQFDINAKESPEWPRDLKVPLNENMEVQITDITNFLRDEFLGARQHNVMDREQKEKVKKILNEFPELKASCDNLERLLEPIRFTLF